MDKKYKYNIVMSKYCKSIYTDNYNIKKWYFKINLDYELIKCLQNEKLNFVEVTFPKLYGLPEDGIVERINYYINLGKKDFYYIELIDNKNNFFKDIRIIIFNKKNYLNTTLNIQKYYKIIYSEKTSNYELKQIDNIISITEFNKYFKKIFKYFDNKNKFLQEINKILHVIYSHINAGWNKESTKKNFFGHIYTSLDNNEKIKKEILKKKKEFEILTMNDIYLKFKDTFIEKIINEIFEYYYKKLKKMHRKNYNILKITGTNAINEAFQSQLKIKYVKKIPTDYKFYIKFIPQGLNIDYIKKKLSNK